MRHIGTALLQLVITRKVTNSTVCSSERAGHAARVGPGGGAYSGVGVLSGQAKPKMVNSTVVDNDTGKSVASTVRTSTGTFFSPHEDDIITAIERRIALASHFPEENGEGMQVPPVTQSRARGSCRSNVSRCLIPICSYF